jgi:hypothetical protein
MLNATTTPNNDPNVVVQLSMVTCQGLPLPRVPSLGSIPAGQDEGLMQKQILIVCGCLGLCLASWWMRGSGKGPINTRSDESTLVFEIFNKEFE